MRDIHHLAINLRGSEDRWAAILAAAENHGIDLRRVDAVDGRDHDIADWHDFDVDKFERCNGRVPMPGEFGCYRSHIRALRTFLDSDAGSAVILEDDAIPGARWLRMPMNRLDPNLFAACFQSRAAALRPDAPDLVAIDGKTSRGSHDRGNPNQPESTRDQLESTRRKTTFKRPKTAFRAGICEFPEKYPH